MGSKYGDKSTPRNVKVANTGAVKTWLQGFAAVYRDISMNCKCDSIRELEGYAAQEYAKSHLIKKRIGNWEIEYECPLTGEQWLMDFPRSDMQGGGPPRLRKLPIDPK